MSEFTDAGTSPRSPGATVGMHPEEVPSRGNLLLLNEIPVATREWWTEQLLGNPEDPDDRGSIERYVGTRNSLVRERTLTPKQAIQVNELPEIQNAAIQLLLGELHQDNPSRRRQFNPAYDYSKMRARLVASGIVTHPERLATDSAIRSSVAAIIKNERDPVRKAFFAGQFITVGIPPEVWQSQEPHVALLHGMTQPPTRSTNVEHLALDTEQVPDHVRDLLVEQLLIPGDPKNQHDEGGVSRYSETVQRLIETGTLTSEQAATLSSIPEIQNAAIQLLLGELHQDNPSRWRQFNPAYDYHKMRARLVASGIISDPKEFNRNPVIRETVTLLLESETDEKRKTFLTEEFEKVGILPQDENT